MSVVFFFLSRESHHFGCFNKSVNLNPSFKPRDRAASLVIIEVISFPQTSLVTLHQQTFVTKFSDSTPDVCYDR